MNRSNWESTIIESPIISIRLNASAGQSLDSPPDRRGCKMKTNINLNLPTDLFVRKRLQGASDAR